MQMVGATEEDAGRSSLRRPASVKVLVYLTEKAELTQATQSETMQ